MNNLDAYDAETAKMVLQASSDAEYWRIKCNDLKDKLKEAKKRLKEHEEDLTEIIQDREKSRAQPTLFE